MIACDFMFLLLTGDHDGLGVATQAVFQQPRQHGVSVGHEPRLLLQVGVHSVLRHVGCTETGNRCSVDKQSEPKIHTDEI